MCVIPGLSDKKEWDVEQVYFKGENGAKKKEATSVWKMKTLDWTIYFLSFSPYSLQGAFE